MRRNIELPLKFPLMQCSALVMLLTSFAQAQEAIHLGMSAPLSGPTKELGLSYSSGAQSAFTQYNQTRAAGAPSIKLLVMDDSYEPLKTVSNTKKLLENKGLFGFFGYVGTPTTVAVFPLLKKQQKPLIAPLTGSDLFRQPSEQFIVNFRASYAEEIATQFAVLVDEQQLKRVALFIQADEFGASVEKNILSELDKRQIKPIYTARYQRNSSDIYDSIDKLQKHQPELVITVGTYSAISEALNYAAEQKFKPVFTVLSFTGATALSKQLNSNHQIYATAVLPWPDIDEINGDDIYKEGYFAASLLINAITDCTPKVTQPCVMKQLAVFDGFRQSTNLRGKDPKRVYLLKHSDQGFKIYHPASTNL